MAHSRVDYTRPLTDDLRALNAIFSLDYLAVHRENQMLAAILAFLWV